MNEILFFGVIIGGIFSFFFSLILIHLGMLIDRYPTANEEERERSIWSPREFTRFSVAIYWALYLVGAGMLIPGTRIMTVGGIATLFGLFLFMITALLFSGATYNLMRAKRGDRSKPSAMRVRMRPGRLLRVFRLPATLKKNHPTKPVQASGAAQAEE